MDIEIPKPTLRALDDEIAPSLVNERQTIALSTLLGNDEDSTGGEITLTAIGNVMNGRVAIEDDKVIFTPQLDYVGPASFGYTIANAQGEVSAASVNLSIQAVPVTGTPMDDVPNQAPVAVDDNLAATQVNPVVINPQSLLANDSDADGDAITAISIQDAANGAATFDGTNVVFTPNKDYAGPASFTYTITDAHGATDTATVNLIIESAASEVQNQAPIAIDDDIAASQVIPVIIDPQLLLANDSDADGDVISAISIQDAVNGEVSFDGSNIIFYPEDGYTGPASFTYTITDNQDGNATATVNLIIEAPDQPIEDNQALLGDREDNILTGDAANSFIFGNQGDDKIEGGAGNDILQGGQGNDYLDGGDGADTFVWRYNAVAPFGNGRETDIINQFTNEDVIDLRELLQNIESNDPNLTAAEQLLAYLNFQYDANWGQNGGTIMSISALGSFNNDDVLQLGDQTIIFNNLDLTQGGSLNNLDILQNMVSDGNLITDAPGFIAGKIAYSASQAQYNETLNGNDEANNLFGGRGDDVINAGDGDDIIQGGQGNDTMDGGAGADTFVWAYNAIQVFGNGRETDVIHNISAEDSIDLRDLLQNEESVVPNLSAAELLNSYLNFEYDAAAGGSGGTIMSVSALGSFNPDDQHQLGDQTIFLSNLDLTQGGTLNDVAIIQNMLTNNNLITDVVTTP